MSITKEDDNLFCCYYNYFMCTQIKNGTTFDLTASISFTKLP
ncbi:hypothetical protein NZD88_19990 [Chryseobacterium antibioticum]|uniref:Uncharacterized protein n=1 Tax=Chryseobacterium pyrolae TaxID=2987481 RepID=A0ABT2IMD8_9FLAO|nr:hypothetical protein [Chryseobacterium pyrolae]MCT2409840.1 hypothetical protein [Chryseobacterium pyrolae]